MALFDRMFGSSASKSPAPKESKASAERYSARRELLRNAVRDSLALHGVPAEWIAVETFSSGQRGGEPGLHLRLVLRHWEPRLLQYTVALQKGIAHRVAQSDRHAEDWLMGVSWQFAPADDSKCPPLPAPSEWKAASAAKPVKATQPAAAPAEDRRAALEKMFNESPRKSRDDQPEFGHTQPMFGATEIMGSDSRQ